MARQSKKNIINTPDTIDDLSGTITDIINSSFKKERSQTVYSLNDISAPTNVTDWISTGCDALDLAISNRPNGGLPVGRIVSIDGLEQSGKSLLCGHILKETQKRGGLAIYFDTESALSHEFLEAIGVDLSKMLYISLDTIEDIFDSIDKIIATVRENDKHKLITIVVDSISAATTNEEQESSYGNDGYATQKARALSKAMRKITNEIAREKILLVLTNQLRMNLNAMAFADKWTVSGGKAIQYHSSVRIRLNKKASLKGKFNGIDTELGVETVATIIKNRVGPPKRQAIFDIYYDSGLDNASSWFDLMKRYNILKGSANSLRFVNDETGEEITGINSSTFKEKIYDNPEIRDAAYKKMCDVYVMTYKIPDNFTTADVIKESSIDIEDDYDTTHSSNDE